MRPLGVFRLLESMEYLSDEVNLAASQMIGSMMSMTQAARIKRAISYAISDRGFPEIKNIVSSLPLREKDRERVRLLAIRVVAIRPEQVI